jgi:hypothetical protein
LAADTSPGPPADPLDHPLYRVAHLHDDRWVTLTPAAQHSPLEHDPDGAWTGARLYRCDTCGELVAVAPTEPAVRLAPDPDVASRVSGG